MKETENGIFVEPEELEQLTKKPEVRAQAPSVSLYQLNKQLIQDTRILAPDEVKTQGAAMLRKWITGGSGKDMQKYAMFLSNENNYYTIFHNRSGIYQTFEDEWIDLLLDLGRIHVIELDTNGALAVWCNYVNNPDEVSVFYLFPYDQGVIQV